MFFFSSFTCAFGDPPPKVTLIKLTNKQKWVYSQLLVVIIWPYWPRNGCLHHFTYRSMVYVFISLQVQSQVILFSRISLRPLFSVVGPARVLPRCKRRASATLQKMRLLWRKPRQPKMANREGESLRGIDLQGCQNEATIPLNGVSLFRDFFWGIWMLSRQFIPTFPAGWSPQKVVKSKGILMKKAETFRLSLMKHNSSLLSFALTYCSNKEIECREYHKIHLTEGMFTYIYLISNGKLVGK